MNPLNNQQALAFVKRTHSLTNPIKPHEEQFIGNILQTDKPQHGWRFKSHIYCKGCRRELSVLDLFLSGLQHHSPKYIHDFLYNGASGGGEVVYDDGSLPTIQVFTHGLRIACVACGFLNHSENIRAGCDYYLYIRPRTPNFMISMSEYWYELLLRGEELPARP